MAKDKVSVPSIQVGLNEPGIAYGGVIYSSTATMGYNGEPTKLDINVALDTTISSTLNSGNPRDFTISKEDLDLTSPVEIKFSKASFFKNMFLTSYDISTDVDSKVMNLQYSDGSILLDRVFVGLIHEHFEIDPVKNKVLNLVELNVKCPKKVAQKINISSYDSVADQSNIHSTDKPYLVCSSTETETSVRRVYRKLANPTGDPRFNYKVLRQDSGNIWAGGFIVVGKEEFSESECDVKDVSYTFKDIIDGIRSFGIRVDLSRFPNRKNINQLTKNYSGTIKDVLQNWANDLGVSFYWDFSQTKPTLGIVNLSDKSIQSKFESAIASIDALDKGHGSDMISGSDIVINSKNHTVDLDGTYSQAFSSNLTRGPSAKQKERKSSSPVIFSCQTLNSIAQQKRGRNYINGMLWQDFFVSMCLSKYAKGLRDQFNLRNAILHDVAATNAGDESAIDPEGYFRALGLREVFPLSYTRKGGNATESRVTNAIMAEVQGSLGLSNMFAQTLQNLDLHYGENYKPNFYAMIAVVDENLKNTNQSIESSIADNFLGRHYTLAAPAAEYFDCNPYYKILETLQTVPSSEFYGQTQHYKTPMAQFAQSITDLKIDGMVTDGDLYKNNLYSETNKLIEQFQENCTKDFFKKNRERGFFHFERNASWFANQRDIDNLLNPYRLTTQDAGDAGTKYSYVPDNVVDRVRVDLTAPYKLFIHDVPLIMGEAVRNALRQFSDEQGRAITEDSPGVNKEMLRLLNVIDQEQMRSGNVKVVIALAGNRSDSADNNPYRIGDIEITPPNLRRNTIEEINALQSLCTRSNETLNSDVDECTTLCENDFVEEMCSSKILGQDKLNCGDLEAIRDSAFATELEPDGADQIKGLSISLKRLNTTRTNVVEVVPGGGKVVKTLDLGDELYSDVKSGETVNNALHFITAPSQYGHQGVLKYNRDLTITDFGQRSVLDGLDKTKPIIKPTVSSVKYQTQDITQDIVSIYDPENRQGIIEGEIPIDILADITGQISTNKDDEYLQLQSISAVNYHNLLKSNISSQQVTTPRETVTYKIYLDQSSGLSSLLLYLKQENGLSGLTLSADSNGYYIAATFSNRPPKTPEMEAIFRMTKPIAQSVQPKMSFYRSM